MLVVFHRGGPDHIESRDTNRTFVDKQGVDVRGVVWNQMTAIGDDDRPGAAERGARVDADVVVFEAQVLAERRHAGRLEREKVVHRDLNLRMRLPPTTSLPCRRCRWNWSTRRFQPGSWSVEPGLKSRAKPLRKDSAAAGGRRRARESERGIVAKFKYAPAPRAFRVPLFPVPSQSLSFAAV